jgi:hypothetical protein
MLKIQIQKLTVAGELANYVISPKEKAEVSLAVVRLFESQTPSGRPP